MIFSPYPDFFCADFPPLFFLEGFTQLKRTLNIYFSLPFPLFPLPPSFHLCFPLFTSFSPASLFFPLLTSFPSFSLFFP